MRIEANIGGKPTQIELPDGSTPEQIDEVLSHASQPQGFLASAAQPIKNIIPEMNAAAQSGLDKITAPFPKSSGKEDYNLARNLGIGLGDVGKRAMGALEYVSSPITGSVRALASQPLTEVGVAAGLDRQTAQDWIGNPIDMVGQIAIPAGAVKYGPKAFNAIKESKFLKDTASTPIGIPGKPLRETAPNIAKGFKASDIDELNAAKEAGHEAVSQAYQSAGLGGATLVPAAEQQLNNSVLGAIDKLQINPAASPKTLGAVKSLYDRITVGKINPITNAVTKAPLTIGEIDGFRKLLRNTHGEDSAAAGAVRDSIDNFLNGINETHLSNGSPVTIDALNAARQTASRNFKLQNVSDILIKANGNPTKIQNGLTKFVSDPENLAGLADEEISALKNAAMGTNTQKLMGMLGRVGFDSNNVVAPIVSGAFTTGVLPVVGTAARYGNKLAVRGSAENALQQLQKGLKKSMTKEEFEAAFQARKAKK